MIQHEAHNQIINGNTNFQNIKRAIKNIYKKHGPFIGIKL